MNFGGWYRVTDFINYMLKTYNNTSVKNTYANVNNNNMYNYSNQNFFNNNETKTRFKIINEQYGGALKSFLYRKWK